MTDAVEAVGQDMDQEAADEPGRREAHDFLSVAMPDAVFLPAEGHGLGVGADQAAVGDRDALGVTAKVAALSVAS